MLYKYASKTPLILALVALFGLGACQTTEFQSQFLNVNKHVDLKQRSYEAADVLVRQTQDTVSLDTPLIIGTLSDINRFEQSTALGRLIPEQVGTRMAQLGYTIQEVKLRNSINVNNQTGSAGEFLTSRDPKDISSTQQAGAVVTGTYALANTNVMVNMRIVDTQTRKILAAYDYEMPLNSDLRALSSSDDTSLNIFEDR